MKGERNFLNRMCFNMLNDSLCCVSLLGERIRGNVVSSCVSCKNISGVFWKWRLDPCSPVALKLLLIGKCLLTRVNQGIGRSQTLLCCSRCALPCPQRTRPQELRARVQPPEARKLLVSDSLLRSPCLLKHWSYFATSSQVPSWQLLYRYMFSSLLWIPCLGDVWDS